MKVFGEKPQYFDGGEELHFPLTLPVLSFWVCSMCGEIVVSCTGSTGISNPPDWRKVRLTAEECKARGIPFYPDSTDQSVLLLCSQCQDEEGKEPKENPIDAGPV